MNQELPREPKFYPDAITIDGVTRKVVIPNSQKLTYEVNDYGVTEVISTYDQNGKPMYANKRIIIPKEVFIEAYRKYIEDK